MLSLILLALAAPAAAPAPAPRCTLRGPTYAKGRAPEQLGDLRATGARKLGELPPARHYLAVERHVGGCPAPAVIRSGIGNRGW
jgi:hypothetical protein